MKNSWRVLDLIILVSMLIDFVLEEWLLPGENIIRFGRCLRILKIISYHHGLQYILSILGEYDINKLFYLFSDHLFAMQVVR